MREATETKGVTTMSKRIVSALAVALLMLLACPALLATDYE